MNNILKHPNKCKLHMHINTTMIPCALCLFGENWIFDHIQIIFQILWIWKIILIFGLNNNSAINPLLFENPVTNFLLLDMINHFIINGFGPPTLLKKCERIVRYPYFPSDQDIRNAALLLHEMVRLYNISWRKAVAGYFSYIYLCKSFCWPVCEWIYCIWLVIEN